MKTVKRQKLIFLVVILVFMLSIFSGCSDNKTQGPGQEAMDKDQYANFCLGAEPMSLDSVKASDIYSSAILIDIMEPLVRLEEDEQHNNVVKPAGAEKWEVSADGLVWTFHLRDNKWSDGQPVKAQDYEYGIKRVLDPKSGAPYSFMLLPIKNAKAVNKGEMPVEQLGVKAIDDKTLQITLEAPTAHFLHLVYQSAMFPQRKDIVEKYGEKYGSEKENLVFNGPFVVDNWVHNSEIILKKNPAYWDNATVKLDTVTYKILNDIMAQNNSLDNGSIDSLAVAKAEMVEKFSKRSDLSKLTVGQPTNYFELFNTKDKLFSNANVRKAFALGIKREEIANVVFFGIFEPAYGWVPKTVMLGDKEYRSLVKEPLRTLSEENKEAVALLKQGLIELGMDPDPSKLTVKMSFGGTSQRYRTIAEYFQQMYKETLGVNVELDLSDWPVFTGKMSKFDYQIGYMSWGADYNDPIAMLDLFRSDANVIYTGWKNAKYDELIDNASRLKNNEERLKCFEEAENILLHDEAVVAPVVYPRTNIFTYKYIKNVPVTTFGTQGDKYTYTSGRSK